MKYRFASCCLNVERHVFEREGQVLHLEPQVFDLLLLLARSAGDLVTHERLIAEVWQGLIVSDATDSARINAARKAVGDTGKAQRVIQTVARRGFRLVVPVECDAAGDMAQARRPGAPPASDGMPMLAVLPFHYLAESPSDMLADGIVDEITSALSRVHEFRVIARQPAFALRDQRPDVRTAAKILGVNYLVDRLIVPLADRARLARCRIEARPSQL